jgi:hypothetical protein
LANGVKGYLMVDYDCEILQWTLLGDVDGAISVDVWMSDYALFPPTSVLESITNFPAKNPRITVGQAEQSTDLAGWTTSIPAGSILAYYVDEASCITRCTVAMKVIRL